MCARQKQKEATKATTTENKPQNVNETYVRDIWAFCFRKHKKKQEKQQQQQKTTKCKRNLFS